MFFSLLGGFKCFVENVGILLSHVRRIQSRGFLRIELQITKPIRSLALHPEGRIANRGPEQLSLRKV